MDRDKRQKSDLGNERGLQNTERDHVTGIRTSDLPVRGKSVVQTMTPEAKKPQPAAQPKPESKP